MSDSMEVPDSWTIFRLSTLRDHRNSCRACLTSVVLTLLALRSAVRLSESIQVYWEIQEACDVFGCCVLPTYPLSVVNYTSPSISGYTVRRVRYINSFLVMYDLFLPKKKRSEKDLYVHSKKFCLN